MALDTLSNVKTELMITTAADDATLNLLLGAAESFVEQYTRRSFAGGTFTETHPAGGKFLFLANYPVAAVTTLRVDPNRAFGPETARAAAEYVVLADRGVVASRTGPFLAPQLDGWPGAVQITYTTPTSQVPAAVKEAYTQLVGHWYRQVKTNADLGFKMLTEDTNGTTTKTFSWSLTSGLTIPSGVLQLLEPFRVPAI
jgi:uncharacterized phiE125 gp8 family phage protein